MLKTIKRAVLALFPELSAGLHLDRYARVLAVADPPECGAACDRFRPRYAVDIEILTPEGERDDAFPVYEAVPLPVTGGAGMEAGLYGAPEPGALLVVGFAYGRPDCPLVRQIYPQGLSLPDLRRGQQRWQQSAAVFQDVDPGGNWRRVTDRDITDESLRRTVRAGEAVADLGRDTRRVEEHSTEDVGGVKRIEAHGALKLLSGGCANLSSADNLNLTTASDQRETIARDALKVVGKDENTTIKRNRAELVEGDEQKTIGGESTTSIGGGRSVTVGADSSEAVSGDKSLQATHIAMTAETFAIVSKDGTVSFLPTLTGFMQEVRDALAKLATHTHPAGITTPPDVQSGVAGHAGSVGDLRGDLESISG